MTDTKDYTTEELTQYLAETQEGLLMTSKLISRFMSVLLTQGVIDETDRKYIVGKMTEEEYIKHYKESHDLTNLMRQMFNFPMRTEKSDVTEESGS